jgi:hypothetical protein
MKPEYDIAFAGAGLAGLSLAVRLAALPDPPRMLLIDPQADESRDRTWCHWHLHNDPFESAITHRWHRWSVGNNGKMATAATEHAQHLDNELKAAHAAAHAARTRVEQISAERDAAVTRAETALECRVRRSEEELAAARKAYNRAYYLRNRDEELARAAAYRQTNPLSLEQREQRNQYGREYRLANLERLRAYDAYRHSQRSAA